MKTNKPPSWATPCHECRGEGEVFDQWSPNMWVTCSACHGMGTLDANHCYVCQSGRVYSRSLPGVGIPSAWLACDVCDGSGWQPRKAKVDNTGSEE